MQIKTNLTKCTAVFVISIILSISAYAFFNQMMQMPQQAMHMMMPQPSKCECKCANVD